jgi:hypothetical protein
MLAELSKGLFQKNWLKLKNRIRGTVIFYKRRKFLLILDTILNSLILGTMAFLFLVTPSLDVEGRKISGVAIITLIVVSAYIYLGVKEYILSRSQKKLSHWLERNLRTNKNDK